DRKYRYEEILAEEKSLWEIPKGPPARREEIRLALRLAREKLTDVQKRAFDLIGRGFTLGEVADALGLKWPTLTRELERMRGVLYKAGLKDYVDGA
ncbi:MAG: hypothetical protein HY548_10335, partial [Elusimicrobia bacterium]|nr:hypothetical protein [Elusimicrobiota bacterium]